MPFRIRSSPAGYPIKPPITAEELGAAIDFPTHLDDTTTAHNLSTQLATKVNKAGDTMTGTLELPSDVTLALGTFQMKHNSTTNTLDIIYTGA